MRDRPLQQKYKYKMTKKEKNMKIGIRNNFERVKEIKRE